MRAAGDGRAVAAGFAHHRGGFAGDRAFIDAGDALDHLAVGGDEIAGLDQHDVAAAQLRRGGGLEDGAVAGSISSLAMVSERARFRLSARARPRPSATASAKVANSTVSHSQTAMVIGEAVGAGAAGASSTPPR